MTIRRWRAQLSLCVVVLVAWTLTSCAHRHGKKNCRHACCLGENQPESLVVTDPEPDWNTVSPVLAHPEPTEEILTGGGEQFNAMAEIARQAKGHLNRANAPAHVQITAARNLFLARNMSGLVVMPGPADAPGGKESREMFDAHIRALSEDIATYAAVLGRQEVAPEVAEVAAELELQTKTEIDLLQTLAAWTVTVAPTDKVAAVRLARQIRNPFIPVPWLTSSVPQEIVRSDVIGKGECQVVLKEIFGIKRRLIAQRIPIWVEPWAARRKIVGYRIVWRLEYVPAEFIKRIVTCNCCCGKILRRVYMQIVPAPLLQHFWRFFPPTKG